MNTPPLVSILVLACLAFLARIFILGLKRRQASFRQTLVAVVTFLSGIYFFLEFFLQERVFGYKFDQYNDEISNALILLGAMAIGLGIINLLAVHFGNIIKGRRGWYNSAALIIGLFVTFGIEIADFLTSLERTETSDKVSSYLPYLKQLKPKAKQDRTIVATGVGQLADELEQLQAGTQKSDIPQDQAKRKILESSLQSAISKSRKLQYSLLGSTEDEIEEQFAATKKTLLTLQAATLDSAEFSYQNSLPKKASRFVSEAFFVPLGAAMFSLLAFYVATAAYRSFRIHSAEAAIMMCSALVVVLGQIPFGALYISKHLPKMRELLMENLSNPAFRAILFGSLIASLAMALRMWLSLEKNPMDSN